MAISLSTLTAKARPKPPRMAIYGPAGIGKTTLAAGTPNPVFLWIEDGRGRLEVPGWPEEGVISSYADVIEAIGVLYQEEHDRQTIVIDSADWLERLVHAETCARHGWPSIEHPGYGKGYKEADAVWGEVLDGLDALRNERGMAVVVLAHAMVRRYENPETEAYDRYKMKLQERAEGRLIEYCDIVCFLNYRVSIIKDDPSSKNSRKRATGASTRVAYFTERPAFIAKNRDGMPDSIDLTTAKNAWENPSEIWNAIAQHIPYYAPAAPVGKAKEAA